jgi:hypothetical protein
MKLSLLSAAIVWLATSLLGMAQTGQPLDSAHDGAKDRQIGEAAPLIFWNREITVFRAYSEQLSPAQRATNAIARIEALLEDGTEWKVEAVDILSDTYPGILITVNGQMVFGLLPEDLDPESGETLKANWVNLILPCIASINSAIISRSFTAPPVRAFIHPTNVIIKKMF